MVSIALDWAKMKHQMPYKVKSIFYSSADDAPDTGRSTGN